MGLGVDQDTETRIRAARLVQRMAVKRTKVGTGKEEHTVVRLEDPDAGAVPALMGCLSSDDPELVRHALKALGQLHLANPHMKVKAGVLPTLEKLLDSEDAAIARSAVIAVPMFKHLELAGKVIAVLERYGEKKDVRAYCLSTLRILAKQRYRDAEQETNPDKSDADCWRAAEDRVKTVMENLGSDPAKWKTWWSQPV
jgi:hypothetical protein